MKMKRFLSIISLALLTGVAAQAVYHEPYDRSRIY